MNRLLRVSPLLPAFVLAACVTIPDGPSIMSLPGTGKNFDEFRSDDLVCRDYARVQVGGSNPNEAAAESVAKSAALGAVLGAAVGAAGGGHSGAGTGAGVGAAFGGLAGTGAGEVSASAIQRRYDNAYIQCMYSKGNRVPVSGHLESRQPQPPAYVAPPPPPPPPAPR